MRRVLSTVLAVALLLGLGALAVLALPNANASLAGAPAVSAAAPEFNPDTPAAGTPKWNQIALPLDVASQGITDAQKVANYISTGDPTTTGTSVLHVMKWDATGQRWIDYLPQDPDLGDPVFTIAKGDPLMVLLNSAQTSAVLSWVGGVPDQGTIHVALAPNSWRFIMVPLDQYATFGSPSVPTGTAATLATKITGGVTHVMKWDAAAGLYVDYLPLDPDLGDPDFPVYIGYPYFVRTGAAAPTQWP